MYYIPFNSMAMRTLAGTALLYIYTEDLTYTRHGLIDVIDATVVSKHFFIENKYYLTCRWLMENYTKMLYHCFCDMHVALGFVLDKLYLSSKHQPVI